MNWHGSEPTDAWQRGLAIIQEVTLAAIVAFAVWPFGCVHPYFEMWLMLLILLSLLICLARLIYRPAVAGLVWQRVSAPALSLLVLAGLVALPILDLPLTRDSAKAQWLELAQPSTRESTACQPQQPIAQPTMWSANESCLNRWGNYRFALHVGLVAALLLIAASFESPIDVLRRLAIVGAITGSCLAIFALGQGTGMGVTKLYWFFERTGGYGPFLNKNHYPFMANCLIGLTLALLLERQEKPLFAWSRIQHDPVSMTLLGSLALQIAALIVSLSRGGVVSGALAIGCILSVRAGRKQAGGRMVWTYLSIAGVVIGLFYWVGFDFLESRFITLSASDTYLKDGRWQLWQAAWSSWLQSPWFGTGGETFRYFETMFTAGGREWNSIQSQALRADNELLDVAIEYGGLAVLALLAFVGSWLVIVLKIASRHALIAGACVGLLAVLFHSLGDFGLRVPACGAVAAIVLGLVMSGREFVHDLKPISKSAVWLGGLLTIVLVCLAGSGFQASVNAARADYARAQAWNQASKLNFPEAAALVQTSIDSAPGDARLRIELARMAQRVVQTAPTNEQIDDWKCLALTLAIQSRDLCPLAWEPQLWLYELHDSLAERDSAEHYLAAAHRLHPTDPRIAYALGLSVLRSGDESQAIEIWKQSLIYSTEKLPLIVEQVFPKDWLAQVSPEQLQERTQALFPVDPLPLWEAARKVDNAVLKEHLLLRAKALLGDRQTDPKRRFDGLLLAARVYADLGEVDASINSYRTALQVRYDDFQARFELAKLLLSSQQISAARSEVSILSRLFENHPSVQQLMRDTEQAAARRPKK